MEATTAHEDPAGGGLLLLQVAGLCKSFALQRGFAGRGAATVRAVSDLDLRLCRGETLGLVGESGCGKTTAGRAILRLIEPDAGRIVYHAFREELRGSALEAPGEGPPQERVPIDVRALRGRRLRALRRHLQVVFQDPFSSLNPRMTVGTIIGEAMAVHRMGGRLWRRERVAELLEVVGLRGEFASRYPHEFSGGQRQRIGIARALALDPRLIICDEAVSALDVSVQAQIVNLLKDLQESYGLAYIFIGHDLSVVRHVADRVAVMYLGRIVEEAAAEKLFESPVHPYTQALLSAIPRLVPGRRTKRILLAGELPSHLDPPRGCAFHPRCPRALDRCRHEVPQRVEIAPGHGVVCFEAGDHEPASRCCQTPSEKG